MTQAISFGFFVQFISDLRRSPPLRVQQKQPFACGSLDVGHILYRRNEGGKIRAPSNDFTPKHQQKIGFARTNLGTQMTKFVMHALNLALLFQNLVPLLLKLDTASFDAQ